VDFTSTLHFAQTTGLIYFLAIFACVLVYALRPKAKQKFDRAARMPLDEE
jgi:cytochrome c oxidase cbb3-type subunit 4